MSSNEVEINVVTKLTLKAMGCNPRRASVEKKAVSLARVYGIASGTRVKTAANGDAHYPILGDFEGVNLETGEVFKSGTLYLPAGLHEMIYEPLSRGSDPIEFGIEVSAIPAENPIGYSYTAKQLYKPAAADPLEKLRGIAGPSSAKALPAPEKKK